jgi:opacity protein-like surface antigen
MLNHSHGTATVEESMTARCIGRRAMRLEPPAFGRLILVGALGAAALAATARPARAQAAGPGFLFGAPHASFTIRTGYDVASANSDLFSTVTNELTLKKSDFSSPTIATDLGFSLNPQVDLVLGLGYSRSAAQSQFRGWLDNNNLPIQQSTSLTRLPLTVSLKAYLAPRGQAIGRLAWVPAKVVPYVGVGAGTMWYSFRQGGDFVDTTTTNVFSDVFQSSGWAPTAHLFAGSDFTITPGMALSIEARYTLANATLSQDFVGFNRIDLSGVSLTAGLTFRF